MHPVLFRLMRMQLRGWLRRQFSGGSVRRTVFAIVGGGMFLLWMTSIAFQAAMQRPKSPEEIMASVPLFLTGFALLPILLGNDDRAIAFTPAEIDFLFPGPFSRRDLVIYKMIKLIISSLIGGLFFGLVMRRFSHSFLAGIAGSAMALVFINLLTTVVSLIRDIIQERAFAMARRIAAGILIAGGAAVIVYLRKTEAPTAEGLLELSRSTPVQVATAPARVFAHVFAATSIAQFISWSLLCLAMIGCAVIVVLGLDKGYMEAALAASQRRQARISRAVRGVAAPTGKPVKAVRLPDLGSLGPAGAIVRKQLITALRGSRGWMFGLAIALGYGYVMSRFTRDAHTPVMAAGIAPAVIMLMMLPQMLRFDFRTDLDHLDLLKSLPVSAFAVALAELAVPTLMMSLLGWMILGGLAAFMSLKASIVIMAALAMVPVGLLIFGLENFVFLILPTRLYAPGQATMAFSGRRIVMMLARMGLIVVGGGLISGAGFGVWAITGSVSATYAACWIVLSLIGVAIVGAVAWAFARFDVSVDMPA